MNVTQTLACALLVAALFLLTGVGRANGQSLTLSSATVVFPSAGVPQLNAGGVEDGGTTVSIDPGGLLRNWTLYLRASSATLSPAGKPVSDLLWRRDGSTGWMALGTADQAIASGIGPATVTVFLRTRLRWAADGPGGFGTDVTYSITTS